MVIRSSGDIDIYCTGQTIMDTYHFSTYDTKERLTGFDIGKYKYDENVEVMMTTFTGLMFSLIPRSDLLQNIKVDRKNIKVISNHVKVENYK